MTLTARSLPPIIEGHEQSACVGDRSVRSLMSPADHGYTDPIDPACERLSSEFETKVRSLVQTLLQAARTERGAAAREARAVALTEGARALTRELARVRAEAAEILDAELARTQAASAELAAADIARARAEAAEIVQMEVARARAEAARVIGNEVRQARVEVARTFDADLATIRAEERHAGFAGLEQLSLNVRRLDQAASLSDVLDELAGAISEQTGRAAVLLVEGSQVRVWRMVGFETVPSEAEQPDALPANQGVVGQAIQSGESAVAQPGTADNRSGLPFARLPPHRVAVAVPVRVGGRIVAVAYADDAGEGRSAVPAVWPEVIEVLVWHASKCLEALTAMRLAQVHSPSPGNQRKMSPTQ